MPVCSTPLTGWNPDRLAGARRMKSGGLARATARAAAPAARDRRAAGPAGARWPGPWREATRAASAAGPPWNPPPGPNRPIRPSRSSPSVAAWMPKPPSPPRTTPARRDRDEPTRARTSAVPRAGGPAAAGAAAWRRGSAVRLAARAASAVGSVSLMVLTMARRPVLSLCVGSEVAGTPAASSQETHRQRAQAGVMSCSSHRRPDPRRRLPAARPRRRRRGEHRRADLDGAALRGLAGADGAHRELRRERRPRARARTPSCST